MGILQQRILTVVVTHCWNHLIMVPFTLNLAVSRLLYVSYSIFMDPIMKYLHTKIFSEFLHEFFRGRIKRSLFAFTEVKLHFFLLSREDPVMKIRITSLKSTILHISCKVCPEHNVAFKMKYCYNSKFYCNGAC